MLEALAAEPDPPTTVASPDEALSTHVADALTGLEVADLVRARSIADVGAGAGFPGLALAVALPRARVDLIESGGR
jgi:16S rRNA (guanine527-N7)-methyltransferase